jgi:hypothetical protein
VVFDSETVMARESRFRLTFLHHSPFGESGGLGITNTGQGPQRDPFSRPSARPACAVGELAHLIAPLRSLCVLRGGSPCSHCYRSSVVDAVVDS